MSPGRGAEAPDPPDEGDLTLWVGRRPLLTFADPPPQARTYLRSTYTHVTASAEGEVTVRFGRPRPGERTTLAADGIRASSDPDGRFLLVDPAGREAELPASGDETELLCDPELDGARHGTFHAYVYRLVEWRCSGPPSPPFKAAVVTIPEGTVLVSGFDGSGKTSVTTALLADATAFLTEERGFWIAPGEVAGLTTSCIAYSLGRPSTPPHDVLAALDPADRRRLRVATRLPARLPGSLAHRVRSLLADRWVDVDIAGAYPNVTFPRTARVDAVVHLLPTTGGTATLRQLDADAAVAMAEAQVRYLHSGDVANLQSVFRFTFPDRPAWPGAPLERELAALPPLVGPVPAWVLRAPQGTPREHMAALVREAVSRTTGLHRDPMSPGL